MTTRDEYLMKMDRFAKCMNYVKAHPEEVNNYGEKIEFRCTGLTADLIDGAFTFSCRNEQQQKLYNNVIDLLLDPELYNLTISGTQGVGKSYTISHAVMHYLFCKYNYCGEDNDIVRSIHGDYAKTLAYTPFFEMDLEFKSALQPGSNEDQSHIFNRYSNKDILIIDEIGRGSKTDYSIGILEQIISKRYANKKKTILITNKTGKQLVEMFDPAILDRLGNDNHSRSFEIIGKSER